MAIHVRIRRSQAAALHDRMRRMLAISASAALTMLLVLGVTLFCVRFLILNEAPPEFIAYVNDADSLAPDAKVPTVEDISSSASAPLPSVMPSVIVANSASAVTMETMQQDFSAEALGLGAEPFGGFGDGFMPGSLGSGVGLGLGKGLGEGDKRGGGKRKGLNDDIQIVLALDASGSMDQLFTLVSDSMQELLLTLGRCTINGKKAKVNVGLVCYGQHKDLGKPFALAPFTQDIKTLRNKLSEVVCDGADERCGEAIQFTVEHFPWNMRERDNMLKIIFIAGNEYFNQGPVDHHAALMQAVQKDIIINTIYCGPPDEEWQAAAAEGKGVGFNVMLSDASTSTPRGGVEDIMAAASRLCACEVIPFGSPQERKEHMKKLPALTKAPTRASHDKWSKEAGRELLHGYAWDAAEVCRREGEDFSLAMVGGLPNLPAGIRSKGEAGALEHIRSAAATRQAAIEQYQKLLFSDNEFSAKALRVIREQAATKGIDMEL